jgi:DNA-directed RNA polymerase specialized sigma24 family protein
VSSEPSQHFVTTRWTRVMAARGDSDSARTALAELCSAYYGPVVAFLTHTGCHPEEPREVAHEFFATLLARPGLSGADPDRGRFRSYLLGALKHFIVNRRVHASREKRGGQADHLSIGVNTDTSLELPLPDESPRLEAMFDHHWAMAVVERALGLQESEAIAAGTADQFHVLKAWLSFESEPGSHAVAASRLGISEGAVRVAIHRLRRRFRARIRAEIAQTLPAGEEVDAELRHLIEALATPPHP